MRFLASLAAAAALFATASAQPAPDAPIGRSTFAATETLQALNADSLGIHLMRAGFTTEIRTEGGQRFILAKQGDIPFQVFLHECRTGGGGCGAVELYAGFTGAPVQALSRINAWNARVPFVRAYLNERQEPCLEMNLILDGGVTPDGLKRNLETWGAALDTYRAFLMTPPDARQDTTRPPARK